jgi:sigma-B regulation protein RsbU (phosphoserine phosphatase)
MFVTLFYALFDLETGQMTYVNAGHNPPLLCEGCAVGNGAWTELTRTGMALGVVEDTPFEQRSVRLGPGDLVFLYTDGVTDATDAQGQQFGTGRLRRVLGQGSRATATQVLGALERALNGHVGETARADDVTVVALSRLVG